MNTERVVSDILGMGSESDWNASDEEDYVEAEASFHIPDRLLREQEGKMADSVQNCKYRLHFCTNIIAVKKLTKKRMRTAMMKVMTTIMKVKTVMEKVTKMKANLKMPMMEANLDLLDCRVT